MSKELPSNPANKGARLAVEFGGYVAPPSHLSKVSKKAPPGRPAELRTQPDCDYSLFRYSPFALPFVTLILISAAVVIGLSLWQGPFGFIRGRNGLRDGVPRDFEISDGKYLEAGLNRGLKGLRAANFVCGMTPIIFLAFALRAGLRPTFLRYFFWTCAFFLFALGCSSSVSFALGLDQVNRIVDCPTKLTFNPDDGMASVPNFKPYTNSCRYRIQISTAAVVADLAQAMSAFVLSYLLVYTTLDANYAWGPGNISVEESAGQPHISFPPPSPFTHIAETRRLYVYLCTGMCAAFIIIAFILMIKLHELRMRPKMVNYRNQVIEDSGWQVTNNRFRLSMAGFVIAACCSNIIDMYMIKRRFVSYTIGTFFFWLFVGFIIVFALDVRNVGKTKDMGCPTGSTVVPLRCVYFQFYGTCWMDFCTFFLIMIYVCYEFLYRIFSTYDTYYFYADSEWLRFHSLFVESTDREAYDWKKFSMDNQPGRVYYYSAFLGISTWTRPKNFVEPEY